MYQVENALTHARRVTKRITNVLTNSDLHRENGSNIAGLLRQAAELGEFKLPSSRIIGLVGNSGIGKSSLINSLLDQGKLAIEVSTHPLLMQYL
jgi:ribosome biogenesis GTPase A